MNNVKIPFFNQQKFHARYYNDFKQAFDNFLNNDYLILGSEVDRFEKDFSIFCGKKFGIGVNSGLDALIIALRVLGIGEGDEVIVPAHTYIASWVAISQVGAIPIAVEADHATMNLDVAKIKEKISSKTKAIMPVHMYGLPCDMAAIMEIADAYSLKVVEDNAQAVGANSNMGYCGGVGHINAASFYPTKNLGALGDAGMITTDDENFYLEAKKLRNYGSGAKYINESIGYNSRLDEIQAYFLNVKMKDFGAVLQERKALAQKYNEAFSSIAEITLPYVSPYHTYHLYVIRTEKRDELQQHLASKGIQTIVHYPKPPHSQKPYEYLGYKNEEFAITTSIASTCLSLPLYPGFDAQDEVVQAVKDYFSKT
jgi:dTDP-4-amino-4,6-dideoxygalactose transaminase